jgi:Na+-transporting methylmalonyl-CoA/oxaloacetate decarboxylase gamma subunit
MNEFIQAVAAGSDLGKGLFLMVCGMGFVFAVQVVFYAIIKLWPKPKAAE